MRRREDTEEGIGDINEKYGRYEGGDRRHRREGGKSPTEEISRKHLKINSKAVKTIS